MVRGLGIDRYWEWKHLDGVPQDMSANSCLTQGISAVCFFLRQGSSVWSQALSGWGARHSGRPGFFSHEFEQKPTFHVPSCVRAREPEFLERAGEQRLLFCFSVKILGGGDLIRLN